MLCWQASVAIGGMLLKFTGSGHYPMQSGRGVATLQPEQPLRQVTRSGCSEHRCGLKVGQRETAAAAGATTTPWRPGYLTTLHL